ncbi:MAG: endonuclease/exonuclease/phosphatase family protein, partial [Chloroflexota bacterium]
ALIPSLLLAGFTYRYWLAIALSVPALLIMLAFAPLFLEKPNTLPASSVPIKIMSYNIWGRNKTVQEAANLIREEKPDILLLQEDYYAVSAILHPQLKELYEDQPLYLVAEPRMGQTIISRYPIVPIEASYRNGRAQKIWIDTPIGQFQVWNVHTKTPYRDWEGQTQQVRYLAQEISLTSEPLIVGGDFNSPELAAPYRLINRYLKNAHWQAGFGLGATYPKIGHRFKGIPIITPVLRIDHIFYSNHFVAHNSYTLSKSGGSDHYPIVAELSLVE